MACTTNTRPYSAATSRPRSSPVTTTIRDGAMSIWRTSSLGGAQGGGRQTSGDASQQSCHGTSKRCWSKRNTLKAAPQRATYGISPCPMPPQPKMKIFPATAACFLDSSGLAPGGSEASDVAILPPPGVLRGPGLGKRHHASATNHRQQHIAFSFGLYNSCRYTHTHYTTLQGT